MFKIYSKNLYRKKNYLNILFFLYFFAAAVELDKNLQKMESRMVSFFEYWTPHWTMLVGQRPEQDELFNKYLSRSCYVYVYKN